MHSPLAHLAGEFCTNHQIAVPHLRPTTCGLAFSFGTKFPPRYALAVFCLTSNVDSPKSYKAYRAYRAYRRLTSPPLRGPSPNLGEGC